MGWIGLDWNLLEWIGFEWNGRNGSEWVGMGWNGLEWIGMDWNGLEWIGMDWRLSHLKTLARLYLISLPVTLSQYVYQVTAADQVQGLDSAFQF